MAQVELARQAADAIAGLIRAHSLPRNTPERFRRSVEPIGTFPRMGVQLGGSWADYRFIVGPWRWMLVIYEYLEDEDRVLIVDIQDARSSEAATTTR